MRVALLIPIAFAASAIVCRYALAGAPAALAVDLAQPLPVVTYWQSFGAAICMLLFGSFAIAGVAYAFAIKAAAASNNSARSLRIVCTIGAISCGAALAFPVVFSSDVYAYAGYGSMLLHGVAPYQHARITLREPLLDAVLWQWGNPPPVCVYGPPFIGLAAVLVAALSWAGAAGPLWGLRVLSCAALVLCARLSYKLFSATSPRRGLVAAVTIALNPVVIWSCAEGHNDILATAGVLAGAVLLQTKHRFAGGFTMAIGGAIKVPALAVAAGAALYARRKPGAIAALAGISAGAVAACVLCVPLFIAAVQRIAPAGHYTAAFSPQYALVQILPGPAANTIVLLLCAVAFYAGVRRAYEGAVDGMVPAGLALFTCIPNPYPWYAVWMLPLAFLTADRWERGAIALLPFLSALRYYGEATTLLSPALEAAIGIAQALPLLAVIAARMYRAHRVRREIRRADLGFARLHSP